MRRFASSVLLALVSLAPIAWTQEAKDVGTEVTVELRNGDRITGTLIEQTASQIVIDHEFLGLIPIKRLAIKPAPPPEPEPEAVDMVEVKSPWSGSFDMSISGKRGDTQEQDTFIEFKARRETERNIDTYRATYERNLQEVTKEKVVDQGPPVVTKEGKTTDTTDRRVTAEARREWFVEGTKWRPFLQGSVDDDKFKNFKRRIRIAAGAAYPWIENDEERWVGRIGAATVKEVEAEDDEWTPEMVLGMEYFRQFTDTQSISAGTEVFPSLDDVGEYQSVSRAEYRMKVDADHPWTLKLGLEQERNTDPDAGDSKNNLTYYFAAGFVF